MTSKDPETLLLRTPHQTNIAFQHTHYPRMTGIVLLNANGCVAFDMKGVSGQEHRPYPIGLWHLVNVYRKLHGIQESLDPLKCLLANSSDSCVCSIPTFLACFPTRLEASLKQQAKLELWPKIPEDLRQAERLALKHLTEGEVEEVHFKDFEFPYLIRLVSDGTFTLSGRQITEHIHLHSLELLYFMKQHRIVQDDYSLPPISPLVIPNQMYALDRIFFKDSNWDNMRSLGSRLSELPAETDVLANIRREEQVQLKGIVRTRTPVRVPGISDDSCEAYLSPDGNFDIVSSKNLVRPSWTVLHAFRTDTFQKGTHEDRLKAEEELESMIEKDPFYALKQIYLVTDPIQSLYAIIQDIYSDMPALEEVKSEVLPNVVEARPSDSDCDNNCDSSDNCDCKYCSPISVLFESLGLLKHQMDSTQRRLDALEQPSTNSVTIPANESPQAILVRMRQTEAALRAEIQIYKDIHQQIHINRQLKVELDNLKSAVGSPS